MTLKFASVLALVAFAMVGCSSSSDDGNGGGKNRKATIDPAPDVSIPNRPNNLDFGSAVARNQADALREAVSALYVLPLSASNYNVYAMAHTMKLNDTTPAGMQSWMQARVQYIVDGNFDMDKSASFGGAYAYQEPDVLPDMFSNGGASPRVAFGDDGPQTIMSNQGTALYLVGKMQKQLVNVNIPGIGTISMTSPRTGVLQIGPGMFPDTGGSKFQNIMFDIYRLGTLFHEARHSDGHGHTLGFVHAICPDGDYKGVAACDLSINGPYTVGAQVMKALMGQCDTSGTCSEISNQVLQIIYADQANRTLTRDKVTQRTSTDAQPEMAWDDAPEGVR